ncbi:MAG: long-chain fatty acid--CoA ligase [Candidatus Thorarchaeota archaeon]
MSENPYDAKPWQKFYDEDIPYEIELPNKNVFEFLDDAAKEFGSRTAIWFMEHKISYKKLKDITDRLATALVDLGVKKGDVVAIMLPNFPQFVFSFYGILKAGATVTACSVLHTEHELAYQLNDSGAEIIIAWDNQIEKISNIKDRTRLRHVIISNIFDWAPMANPLGQREPPEISGTIQFLKLINKTKPKPPKFETNPKEDIAVLQYTGGTTGLPKGAMLTHSNLASNVIQVYEWNKNTGERGKGTVLTTLPLFHIYGMNVCMNFFIYMGITIALAPDPRDQKTLFEIIKSTHPEFFPGVPTMYMRLLERDDLEDYVKDLKSIKVCNTGAAPMPPEVLKEFEERTGATILEGYGMTEASPATHVNPYGGKRKIGSVGLALPSTETKIVDIDDYTKIVPIGEQGEIMIKGPQIMKGYWNKPEETANQLKDGWLLTGDIGKIDEEGYLFILDRKKDMINVSGFKVYPRELEDVLFEHEAIENAAVIGVPDPDLLGSEKVNAYIVLKDGYRETDEMKGEIKEFLRQNVAPYKVPKHLEFRKELPETLVGKVLRKDLKDIEARKRGEEV